MQRRRLRQTRLGRGEAGGRARGVDCLVERVARTGAVDRIPCRSAERISSRWWLRWEVARGLEREEKGGRVEEQKGGCGWPMAGDRGVVYLVARAASTN